MPRTLACYPPDRMTAGGSRAVTKYITSTMAMLVHIIRYVVHTTLFARAGRERGAAVGSGGGGGGRRLWCRGRWLCRVGESSGWVDLSVNKRRCVSD